MSVSWTPEDLVSVLRHERIPLTELRVGDIMVGEHGPEHVARLDLETAGKVGVFDVDDYGVTWPIRFPGSKEDTTVEILARDIINPEGMARMLEPL